MEGRRIGRWSNGGEENNEDEIKKGPWKAEEDEVLLDHVNKYGPRDWSSIPSNGLLRRTGKSCRLRWVNKLRPNLKNGVMFSAEEERTVIDLQAQFGNKWARIATYLPGRTDNDVKNFWSSRRKRLARAAAAVCKQPQQQQQRPRRDGTTSVKPPARVCGVLPPPSPLPPSHETEVAPSKLLGPSTTSREGEGEVEEAYWWSSWSKPFDNQYYVDNFEAIQMLDLINNNPSSTSSSFPFEPDDHLNHLPFLSLPQLVEDDYCRPPDFPSAGLGDLSSMDVFGEAKEQQQQQQQQQCVVVKHETRDDATVPNNNNNNNNPLRSPDSFIDDFPIDMFDNIEHLPSPI